MAVQQANALGFRFCIRFSSLQKGRTTNGYVSNRARFSPGFQDVSKQLKRRKALERLVYQGRIRSSNFPDSSLPPPSDLGEDAAAFDITTQSTFSWLLFTAILAVVLAVLYISWIDPETGYGSAYINAVSSLSSSSEVVMVIILFTFALVHSGLASLRGAGEKLVGERAFRVIYAASSLPLAVSALVYFMNHSHDGVQLWDVRSVFGVRETVWTMSFISFFFLYPSTFNLLEVAAVDKPKVHMWETGIMRITRHPQMVGQFLWCFAHTLWIGSSFTLAASAGLLTHHLFGLWHGDKRLLEKHGEAYRESAQASSPSLPFWRGVRSCHRSITEIFSELPTSLLLA